MFIVNGLYLYKPFTMNSNKTLNAKHLYSRAGFGIHYAHLQKIQNQSVTKWVDGLFDDSAKVDFLRFIEAPLVRKKYKPQSSEERKKLQQMSRENTRRLNLAFLNRLSTNKGTLREKMTLFLHGHFACRFTQNPIALQKLNNIHRNYAFGNFKKLTEEVSKSQAMLSFLNNQQNRKGKPNENFARELMELFTLGRGNYNEQDVKESAKAFTGWMFDKKGDFIFRAKLHDAGQKTFFDKTGNYDGHDILEMIFKKKEAAYFITGKLYQFFVNENINKDHVKELGDYFYSENYELEPLLRKMFSSDWFYEKDNVGNKIKSPIELIVGLNKEFYITYDSPEILLKFQQALGQTLFYPPNVAGWNEGKSYIDSSSLMLRLNIPSTVINSGIIEFEGKSDPDDEAFIALSRKQNKKLAQKINATVDWGKFLEQIPAEINTDELASFLLQPKVSKTLLNSLSETADLKTKVVQIVSTPEYQLC